MRIVRHITRCTKRSLRYREGFSLLLLFRESFREIKFEELILVKEELIEMILNTNTRFSRDYEFILIDTWEDMRTIIAIVDPAYEITGEIYEHEDRFEDIVESITGCRSSWGFSDEHFICDSCGHDELYQNPFFPSHWIDYEACEIYCYRCVPKFKE